MKEILPDSRPREAIGSVSGPGGMWSYIFCANCGKRAGRVLEQTRQEDGFAFYLCSTCFETYGELTNMMVMPDEIWWARIQEEQLEKYGRLLNPEDLIAVVEADSSPLATLIKQGR